VGLEKEIQQLENEVTEKQQLLTALRKKRVAEPISDYLFKDKEGNNKLLSEMFGNSNELLLIHNMGKSCAYCTLWADELNGISNHMNNRVPLVVISPNEPNVMKEFAESRTWNFDIYSSKGNTFKKDMGFENVDGMVQPGVSVFTKDDKGNLFHYNKATFGPGDAFSGIWHYLDLLPNGSNKWSPKFSY
jgi:predicted dithiol-disulfide oxidoreductase (DUF899 family)